MDLILPTKGRSQRAPWTPAYLDAAATDARKFLTEVQYEYAIDQVLSLCEEEDPTHPLLTDVDAIGEFHELRDKHGVLGKINLRIYFWVCRTRKMIVVLGAVKKEAERKTPVHIVKRHKWRKRRAEELIEKHFAGKGTKVSANTQEGQS